MLSAFKNKIMFIAFCQDFLIELNPVCLVCGMSSFFCSLNMQPEIHNWYILENMYIG